MSISPFMTGQKSPQPSAFTDSHEPIIKYYYFPTIPEHDNMNRVLSLMIIKECSSYPDF